MSFYSTRLKSNSLFFFTGNVLLPDLIRGSIILSVTQTWNCVIILLSSVLSSVLSSWSPVSPYNITSTIGNQWPNLHPLGSDFQHLSTIAPPSQCEYSHQNNLLHILSWTQPTHDHVHTLAHVFPLPGLLSCTTARYFLSQF